MAGFTRYAWVFLLAYSSSAGIAQSSLPSIHVYGEEDNADSRICQVTYASAIAQVEATLRYNRVRVATREDAVNSRAITAYVNINTFPLRSDSLLTGACVANLSLSLKTGSYVVEPSTGRRHWAQIVFCDRSVLFSGRVATLQSRINDDLRDLTNECLAEYSGSIRSDS